MAISPFDRAESALARAQLEQLGYRIEIRHDRWFECRVSLNEEDWVGRGSDEQEAIAHALSSMLPSRAARVAFRAAMGSAARGKSVPAQAPSQPPSQPPSSADESTRQRPALAATPEFSLDTPTIEVPIVSPSRHDDRVDATRVDAPLPPAPRNVDERTTAQVTILADTDRTEPPTAAGDVLRDLEELRFRVLTIESEIALMAPDLQRLHLLGWMARARALESAVAASPAVEFAAGTVVALLSRMARAYFTGNIGALGRTATPAVSASDLHAAGPLHSWQEVAAAAAERLDALDALARGSRGLDEYGWSDSNALRPRATEPDQLLERVLGSVERAERALDTMSSPANADPALLPALVDDARRVRWLRGAVADDVGWGTAMGTLRRIAARHPTGLESVARTIDPTFSPSESWSTLLGSETERTAGNTRDGDEPNPIVSRVREHVAGRRLLFVGHREDADLHKRLEQLLRLAVEWTTPEPARLDGHTERARRRAYDFVVSAIGFRSISADRALADACRAAKVPLLRVDHPGPIACARALGRELGLITPPSGPRS